jgi:palmitoyltransferase
LQIDSTKGWHICAVCETLSPPRAWHCEICKTCILKREHHCAFTGCCVGFHNFRYFYLFLVHLCLATIYASYFNNYFIWNLLADELHWSHIVRLVMPLSILFFGIDTSMTQLYMFYYSVTLIGCLFTGILIFQQSHLVFHNQTSFERNKKTRNYDCDRMESIRDSLGVRWYLTPFSPFIKSDLPHQGIEWMDLEEYYAESSKSQYICCDFKCY